MHPGHNAAFFQLADLAVTSGHPQQAAAFYKSIPKNSPYFHDADLRFALSLAASGEISKATSHLSRLIFLYPDDIQFPVSLAGIYMRDSDYTKAAKILNRIAGKPDMEKRENWILFYQRGIVRERLGKWKQAESDLRKALASNPESDELKLIQKKLEYSSKEEKSLVSQKGKND